MMSHAKYLSSSSFGFIKEDILWVFSFGRHGNQSSA
jgi:hypothetical protein